jgi:hypothetical protein
VTQAHPETGKKIGYMRFGISGPIAEGTVNVYLTANEKGAWDYTLVNVTTSYQRIIVHDERVKRTRSHRNQTSEAQLMEEAIQ